MGSPRIAFLPREGYQSTASRELKDTSMNLKRVSLVYIHKIKARRR